MSESRWFQWVAGDRRGEILVLNDIVEDGGIVYLSFKDGSRINEEFVAQLNQRDLTRKLMAEIDSPQNCWKFVEKTSPDDKPRMEKDANSGEYYEIPPVEEIVNADLSGSSGQTRPGQKTKKTIELVPPIPTAPTHSAFGKIQNAKQGMPPAPIPRFVKEEKPVEKKLTPISKNESDPVYILMSKAKKMDTEIQMVMIVSLPQPSLYQIAKDSFENGDEKFIDYIVDEITVDEIKKALKGAIYSMYENPNQSLHV
jgi:hypothetical protein